MKRDHLNVPGIRLAYIDYGGNGSAVLLLHGLYGRGSTWAETAPWLVKAGYRVVALDQRGHGLSDKPAQGYTRKEFVADAAAVIEMLGLRPAIVIGHSMGALNAWCLAAGRPDLVRAVVLEDMTASATSAASECRQWVADWPVPFPTMAAVRRYFDGCRTGMADYFQECFAEGPDGYRPLAGVNALVAAATGMEGEWWDELSQVTCPALVVKGSLSFCPRTELQEMAQRLPKGEYAEVSGAYHVVHYDQPAGWRAVVERFLQKV